MNGLFEAEFCLRLVLTLGHFLWQGALIGVVGLAAGRVLRKRSSGMRYAVHLVALAAMPVCAVVTFSMLKVDVDVRDDLERSPVDVAVVTNRNAQNPLGMELASDRPETYTPATSDWDVKPRADKTVAPAADVPETTATDSTSVVPDVAVRAEETTAPMTAGEPGEAVATLVAPVRNPPEARPTAPIDASFDWTRSAPWLVSF